MQTPQQTPGSRRPLTGPSNSTARRIDSSLGFTPSSKTNENVNNGRSTSNNSSLATKLTAYTPHRRQEERSKALAEVEAVLSSSAYSETYMDSFHLLGVVTNPRGSLVFNAPSGAIRSNSRHGPPISSQQQQQHQQQQQPTHQKSASATGGLSDYFDLDNTITSMTETIDSLNTMFDSISRSYLGNYYLDNDTPIEYETELGYEDVPTVQGELPQEIVNLDLSSVEEYLKRCGTLAIAFTNREGESERILVGEGEASELKSTNKTDHFDPMDTEKPAESELPKEDDEDPTKQVPEIFFSPYFNLTDPKTFESLLVLQDNSEAQTQKDLQISQPEKERGMEQEGPPQTPNVKPLMTIQKPETLTQHLDVIEIALLNQVRSKSDSFFRETNRFSYLKSLVTESVQEVQTLREQISSIRQRSVTDIEMIPAMDDTRADMRALAKVLDEIRNIVEIKGSVAGLIAANDYIGAVEAIYHARQLLSCESNDKSHFMLGKLTALSKIDSQLTEYENLVVMDLTNELVQSFLMWGNQSSSTNEILNGSFSGNVNASSTTSFFIIPQSKRQKVKDLIQALALCRKLDSTADLYKEKLCEIVRVTVRTIVSECAVDAVESTTLINGKSGSKLGENANHVGFSLLRRGKVDKSTNIDESTTQQQTKSSITEGVTSMTFDQFTDCLDMIFEQILALMNSAVGVSKFFREEGISFRDEETQPNIQKHDNNSSESEDAKKDSTNMGISPISSPAALVAAADLSHKSVTELLRLRKEAHSLVSFEEMKKLWDSCLAFTLQLEKFSGQKAYGLRSTLLAQAKAFVERQHESNMASLVAALDREKWSQSDVSYERQSALTRLCSGRAVLSIANKRNTQLPDPVTNRDNLAEAEVEGKHFRVVWSCLLLVEMVMGNVACAAHFQTLATNVVGKVTELLRLFNTRSTQLVLGAGAIHSAARLKSINAKHLALVTQCIGLIITILPHVRAALMAQLPNKQHSLLVNLDKIKKEYVDHNEKVFGKFVSIIGGIVEHGLAPRISKTDFDARAKTTQKNTTSPNENVVACCPFLEGIASNTKKLYMVLKTLLPPEDLADVFSRISAYVDSKVPSLFSDAAEAKKSNGKVGAGFKFPVTDDGKRRMLMEVHSLATMLNSLEGLRPWDFEAIKVLEGKLEYKMNAEESNVTSDKTAVIEPNEENVIENGKSHDIENETERNHPPAQQANKGSIHETSNVEGQNLNSIEKVNTAEDGKINEDPGDPAN